ncbi:MAG TPA: type II toxin-antitoxin system VapC family toxin [Candidatus Binatus sp.]|nr:type II toxin-antitoxin system VapC family toxin [Candidatus Binatus sp.]
MTVALDTNVVVALWDATDALNLVARRALEEVSSREALVMCGIVYAELIGAPGRTEAFVDRFCEEAGIAVEWELEERIWRRAGVAFQGYATRRKKQSGAEPWRLLADFLIGAHTLENGYKLLTLDGGMYRRAFPGLRLEIV